MRNAGFPFNAPLSLSPSHKKQLYYCGFCFFLSPKTSSYSFSFEVEAHYGWEKNFGSISTEVASHTRIFHILLPTYSNHSFAVPLKNVFFFFPYRCARCRLFPLLSNVGWFIKRKHTHTTFRSEAGYTWSSALRESGTKAQVTTVFFATRRQTTGEF